jgi:hypothetical protein
VRKSPGAIYLEVEKETKSQFQDVHLPGFYLIKTSTTTAWIPSLSPSLKAIQARYDTLMSDWINDRNGTISSNDYDYFVYSTGSAWPKAVLETGTEDNLAKVQHERGLVLRGIPFSFTTIY